MRRKAKSSPRVRLQRVVMKAQRGCSREGEQFLRDLAEQFRAQGIRVRLTLNPRKKRRRRVLH